MGVEAQADRVESLRGIGESQPFDIIAGDIECFPGHGACARDRARARAAREPSMTSYRGSRLLFWRSFVVGLRGSSRPRRTGRGDSVIMKSGIVYRSQGAPDRDNTLVYISDGLKRVVVRDSKIERIEANNAFRTGEKFQLVQPMTVHGGLMPKEVISVEAGPWNERGRRSFQYVGSRLNKPIRMEQAIIEIGPHIVQYPGRRRLLGRTGRDQPGSARGR